MIQPSAPLLALMPHVSETALAFAPSTGVLYFGHARFDAWHLAWRTVDGRLPNDLAAVAGAADGLLGLARTPTLRRRVPVGVIGPKDASPDQMRTAEEIGRELTGLGLQLLTSGKSGVMKAASKGGLGAGDLPVGILPDEDWTAANPYVAVPIATGLGPARNAVIARVCEVLIAVGGEYGTLSKMAFGIHFGRLVLALDDAPAVRGVRRCANVARGDRAHGHARSSLRRL